MDKLTPVITWVSSIVSALIITALTVQINARAKRRERMEEEERRERAEREEEERRERRAWRASVDERISEVDAKIDMLTDATQTTMRTTLLHYCEKYLTRGWVTPEERASLFDMHEKYSRLNANGYIDGYIQRVDKLPDREI